MLPRWIVGLAVLSLLPLASAQHGESKISTAGLQPAPGLKVTVFASEPLLANPVAFSMDEQGRCFVAETHRYKDAIFDLWTKDDRWKLADFAARTVADREAFLRQEFATNLARLTKDSEIIRLVRDQDGDGVADVASVFAEGFNQIVSGTAAGVLATGGQLWFTCIPDVWSFRYNTNGRATSRELLHTGYGVHTSVSGHDLHGLALGPDGRLYFSVGDRGANVMSREGQPIESLAMGAVFRCEPDGSNLELFARGLRNPQELAFDDFGNLWTHDNDTSGEDPSRVLMIVEGGDYGWRQSYQFMPGFGPWVLEELWKGELDDVLPMAGSGAQGPSGLAAYPGVGLPEKYRGALFGADFPQGVWAYFFVPQGASYELRKEKFLWNLGSTDVDMGPDGAVYVSDWGKSYNMPNAGRIYRVFDPGLATNTLAREVKERLAQGFNGRSVEECSAWLGHADRRLRQAAQFALEKHSDRPAALGRLAAALASTHAAAGRHAIWALGNLARRGEQAAVPLLLTNLAQADAERRAQVAAALGNVSGQPEVARALLPLLNDTNARVQMMTALALAHAGTGLAEVGPALVALAERSAGADRFIQHAVVYALERLRDRGALVQAAAHPNPQVRQIALLAWRRGRDSSVAQFLQDPDPALRRNAARAINDVPISRAWPQLAECLERPELLVAPDPQLLSRAINANFRLGQAEHWRRLVAFAERSDVSIVLRSQALAALADWNAPGPLDRIVGLWRPVEAGRAPAVSDQLEPVLERSLTNRAPEWLEATLACAEKLRLSRIGPALGRLVRDGAVPEDIRARALGVMAALRSTGLEEAVRLALAAPQPKLRAEAVARIPDIAPERAVPLLQEILVAAKETPMRQSALATLGRIDSPEAAAVLGGQLELLRAGTLSAALHLDLLEAAALQSSQALLGQLKSWEAALSSTDPLARHRPALVGGNAARGRKLFQENDAIGCQRCHAVKGQGGTVGPDLAGVASRLTRDQLLESVVYPNAQVATGYETVTLLLKSGATRDGMVKGETPEALTLLSGEDGLLTVKKADIASRQRSLSAMPEGLAQLIRPLELRDLVEYLSTLK